ncbi:MAG: hypothetical protein ABI207_09325 [Crocinitomicaceae bacterium]
MSLPAISINKLITKKFKIMEFEGIWKDLIGTPECSGSTLIYGDSGQGKTTFALGFMKYLCGFKKCAYIPLEEKAKLSFAMSLKRANLKSISNKVKLWIDYTAEDLDVELTKSKSPDVIFIDSLQYFKLNKTAHQELTRFEFIDFIHRHPKKLFVFISQVKNDLPKGSLGDSVYYHSDTCINIQNFNAIPTKNRFGGGSSYEFKNKNL